LVLVKEGREASGVLDKNQGVSIEPSQPTCLIV